MATLGTGNLTLLDHMQRLAPDGQIDTALVETLEQMNPFLTDIDWREGNLPTGMRTTQRAGLPTVYYRLINRGVPTSKSVTVQVDESVAMLEAFSEVDQELAELGGNPSAVRAIEARAFLEAMTQQVASSMFYGNSSTSPEQFNGLAVRYSSLAAANAQNIIDAAGTGTDNMSIWLCVWGPNSLHGIFPKGSRVGLQHEDLGIETVETTAGIPGSRMRAYRDHWRWKVGLALRDWRYVVRIANIDVSNLVANSSAADLDNLMVGAIHRIPNLNAGNAVIYMNRTAMLALDRQRKASVSTGGGLSYGNVDGIWDPRFRGIPIRVSDVLLETEARVV